MCACWCVCTHAHVCVCVCVCVTFSPGGVYDTIIEQSGLAINLICNYLSGLETRRILTRSKTGSLTPKQFTDSITSTTTSVKMASKSSADDVLFINKDGEISRITRSKTTASASLSTSQFYRLGQNTILRVIVEYRCVVCS